MFNFDNEEGFSFTLKKAHLYPHSDENPEGLNLKEWFANYAKEAKVSTAGIRGPQNILYPQDTRFPINLVGIVLATLAKALVVKEKYGDKCIIKLAGSEVRYNSQLYLDAIEQLMKDVELPLSIKAFGVTEKDFYDKLDEMVELAFDDQCTGANPA